MTVTYCPKCTHQHHPEYLGCDGLRTLAPFSVDGVERLRQRLVGDMEFAALTPGPVAPPEKPLEGGKLKGDHYYRVAVPEPISPEVKPYTAECADIIEALGMTFNEGEAFKALWRLAAARQGRGKPGNKAQYDADKAAHYAGRVAACVKRSA